MKLLISITSPEEASAAIDGGADIIDIKNPAEGALGAAPVATLQEICTTLPADRQLSAALGDSDPAPGVLALAAYGAATFGVHYVKIALARISPEKAVTLLDSLHKSLRRINPNCVLIAVGYADAAEINAMPWQSLPEIARAAHIGGCLIDTAQKDGRRLFDHCSEAALAAWITACRQAALLCALAGSLQVTDLPALQRLSPDVVGFRGAACRGDRVNGRVDVERVAALRAGC